MGRMATASWEARVVSTVRYLMLQGNGFDVAWYQALRYDPPGPLTRTPVEPWVEPTLFEQDVEAEPSVVESLRGYCEDALNGRKPALRHFSIEALRESDHASAAHRAGHIRTAA